MITDADVEMVAVAVRNFAALIACGVCVEVVIGVDVAVVDIPTTCHERDFEFVAVNNLRAAEEVIEDQTVVDVGVERHFTDVDLEFAVGAFGESVSQFEVGA